jgi:Ca2+-binding EF-hand superfamily protein
MSRARVQHHGGKLFNTFDKNSDKLISRKEFIETLLFTEEKRILTDLFEEIDVDGDGTISAKELQDFLSESNTKVKRSRRMELQKYVVFERISNYFMSSREYQGLYNLR